jgi:membrane fusion protein (multidrug efflux system)
MTAPLDPAPPPRRKRTIALLVFLIVAALAGVAGFLYWRHSSQFEETDDAFVDGNITSVSPQVAGRVTRVLVKDNQDVKAGDVLVEIEPTDFASRVTQMEAALKAAQARVEASRSDVALVKADSDATLAQAKAGVEAAQATVERLQSGVTEAEATVRWAQAQVQSAQADVEAAAAEQTRRAADLKRFETIDPRAMSQQQLDAARAAASSAEALLSAAQKRKAAADAQVAQEESRLTGAKSAVAEAHSKVAQAQGVLQSALTAPQKLAAAEAQVKTSEASAEQARADLQDAQNQLGYTRVVAPVSGRVTRKSIQPGQYVEAGRALLTIVQPEVWVTANFKETQLARMHVGQRVEIRVDMYPGRSFEGKIDSFQSGTGARFSLMPPENATGNFVKVVQRIPVKITFNDDAGAKQLLGPGMSVVPIVRVGGDEGTPAPITHAPEAGSTMAAH